MFLGLMQDNSGTAKGNAQSLQMLSFFTEVGNN